MILKYSDAESVFTLDIRYAGYNNLTGKPLAGYSAQALYGSESLLKALQEVARVAYGNSMRLIIYDAYRPQKAVDDLVRWTQNEDTSMKERFYPRIEKKDMLALGYIAQQSGHSRGSTVDLSLIKDGETLDMGTEFDFMDPLSCHGDEGITSMQSQNRRILKDMMISCGFKPYENEWWHYTLINEPFPHHYFDTDVI